MALLDKDRLLVLPGGTLPTGGVSSADLGAVANDLATLQTEVRNGRVFYINGTDPSGVTIPDWADVVLQSRTANNTFSVWRPTTAPTDGLQTDDLKQSMGGGWFVRLYNLEARTETQKVRTDLEAADAAITAALNTLTTEVRDGRVYYTNGTDPSGVSIPEWADVVIQSRTANNTFSAWRPITAPADGVQTDDIKKSTNNLWFTRLYNLEARTETQKVRADLEAADAVIRASIAGFTSDLNNGRVYVQFTPQVTGKNIAAGADTILTVTNTAYSMWNPTTAPADGLETATVQKDAAGNWWSRLFSSSYVQDQIDINAAELARRKTVDNYIPLPLEVVSSANNTTTVKLPDAINALVSPVGTAVFVYVPTVTNTAADPVIVKDGVSRTLKGENNETFAAGQILAGVPIWIRQHSSTTFRRIGANTVDINAKLTALAAADTAEATARLEQLRLNGEARLTNVGGTADAITADLPAGIPAGWADSDRMLLVPTQTNTSGSYSTLTVGTLTRQLCGTTGAAIASGFLKPGRRYMLQRYSNQKWQITQAVAHQQDVTVLENRATAVETSVSGLQQDMALHDTVRSAIPMTATQAEYGSSIVLTPVSALWPTGTAGYDYSFIVPLGKAKGATLTVTQGGRTRTVSAATAELRAGDRIIYKITSNNSGEIVQVGLSGARLAEIDQSVANAPQVVTQRDASMPDRPSTASVVFWNTWDDPGAKRKKGDIWLDLPTPSVPDVAPALKQFYIRPTLGSLDADIVLRGFDLNDIPVISGFEYKVNSDASVSLPAASPQSARLSYTFTNGVEIYVRLASKNFVGTGPFSEFKYYTPRASDTFSHPLTPRGTTASAEMAGTYGFNNLNRTNDMMVMNTTGAGPDDPNSLAFVETDVNGLSGDRIYAEVDLAPTGTLTSESPTILIGLNNPWDVGSNVVATSTYPSGLFMKVTRYTWSLSRRTSSGADTALTSGTTTTTPERMRFEREGSTVRGYLNDVQVFTFDISAQDAANFNTAKGASLGMFRPSGGSTAYIKAKNFEAGLLA